MPAIVREAFLVLEGLDRQTTRDAVSSGTLTPVQDIKSLLPSSDWNDRHLFLACLESVDPIFWAGTSEDFSLVLTDREVEIVMMLLDSKDSSIRVKVCHRCFSLWDL